MFNVICLKWGNKYPAHYVNKLYGMVSRNLTYDHKFYCFTEDPEGLRDEVNVLPLLDNNLNGWWNKLWLFSPEVAKQLQYRPTLFLDLDIVILSNIDCFFERSGSFSIIEEWQRKRIRGAGNYNSSVFKFKPGMYDHIWHNFQQNPQQIMKRLSGDQNWIVEQVPDAKVWPDEWCKSFKWHCAPKGSKESHIPKNSRMIIFHGRPNPDEAVRGTKQHPAAPWVEQYWKE